jgi:hypothetical protein
MGRGLLGRSSEEDDMSDATPALDEAFERRAAASFELPNGFVNHGAMACEALAMLGCTEDIDSWARRFARAGGASVEPVVPAGFEWRQALGDYRRLPEWIGYFTQAIAGDGWPAVVATWVPRLLPALSTALFHGAIRTAHAVRAIDAVDTPPRRGELARALGYWAARYRGGQPAGPLPPAGDVRMALVRAAAGGASRYLPRPDIFHLHGVTGAMAAEILDVGGDQALAQVVAILNAHHQDRGRTPYRGPAASLSRCVAVLAGYRPTLACYGRSSARSPGSVVIETDAAPIRSLARWVRWAGVRAGT